MFPLFRRPFEMTAPLSGNRCDKQPSFTSRTLLDVCTILGCFDPPFDEVVSIKLLLSLPQTALST